MVDGIDCPEPHCREDLKNEIVTMAAKLKRKFEMDLKTKVSGKLMYGIVSTATGIILVVAGLMYGSYASARDDRMDQIKENRKAIGEVKESQSRIETKLDIEIFHLRDALTENNKLYKALIRRMKENDDHPQ